MIAIIIWIICAIACVSIAESKGRNQGIWGIMGFLFGIFAVILLACLPNIKKN